MRIVCVWVLLLLAVLVPATASIVGVAVCPSLSPAKQAQLRLLERSHEMKTRSAAVSAAKAHAARMPGMRLASAGPVLTKHVGARHSGAKQTGTQQIGKHGAGPQGNPDSTACDDCGTCTHCASCGSGASMLAMAASPLLPQALEGSLLPEPAPRRAEFLSVGQERPPRLG